jgi:hypothetical protein
MPISSPSFRLSFASPLGAALWATCLAAGCGAEFSGEDSLADVEAATSSIIGGSVIDNVTRRNLGLVTAGSCSASTISPDWVLTATHCLPFDSPTSVWATAPRPDNTLESRRAVALAQVGRSDLSLVQLEPAGTGSQWPGVRRQMWPGNINSLIGQNITCYGQGDTAYKQPLGTGTTNNGVITWKSLTDRVDAIESPNVLLTYPTSTGNDSSAPGDSGGGCLYNNLTVAVASFARVDCDDPTTESTCKQTIRRIHTNGWRSTSEFASYIDHAPLRAATATFRQIATQFDAFARPILLNGWFSYPSSTNDPQGALVNNTVHLRGAIATNGTNAFPFQLPPGLRPSADIYVPTNLCNAKKGRLKIDVGGVTTVEAEAGDWAAAKCFTSLDGISFAVNSASFTNVSLKNGWVRSIYTTRNPAVRNVNGIVRMMGAVQGGSNPLLFTLDPVFRPIGGAIWVPVDLCNATKGRLYIASNGDVTVQAFNQFSDATCFTSLEGVSFPIDSGGFMPLQLLNGWDFYPTHRSPAVKNDAGIIRFHGAMRTGGTNMLAFQLHPAMRPATYVYVAIDLCHAQKGRLRIQPDGNVFVETNGALSAAQCFTNLEGASFGL